MTIKGICVLAGLLALAAGPIHGARAEGALAVGSTGDITKDGVAYGYSNNKPTREAAKATALEQCRSFQSAPKAAARCEVVATYRGECVAIAMDPQAGTPGFGWAVAADEETAKERALAACKSTAGRARVQYCQHDKSYCDRGDGN